ncbi:MAG: nucleotidyl transferase AbiEii/AbiGii toxin family protein, partial [Ignavibacteria bacterium]|nr:nucleotidyl transferase AbiEii/AbiGii toxin family protein [Ignavibacteria bacterium]
VFIGGTVVGCHSGQPRSTKDVDLIIPPDVNWKKAVGEILKLSKGSKVKKHPSFIEIYENSDLGETELVDIVNVSNGSYGMTFKNLIKIDVNGIDVSIPTAEMMVVLKYTAAVSPIRTKNKQMQDWIDIYNIVDGNKSLSLISIRHLADQVVPGYGDDIYQKLKDYNR